MDPNEMSREAAIHIVDDDANVRDALSLLMLTADLEAQAFPTAEALLEAVDLEKPCCIIARCPASWLERS